MPLHRDIQIAGRKDHQNIGWARALSDSVALALVSNQRDPERSVSVDLCFVWAKPDEEAKNKIAVNQSVNFFITYVYFGCRSGFIYFL